MSNNTRRKTFRKVITSPELTAQINLDNIKMMERIKQIKKRFRE